jgi:hypothetical protein
MNERIQKLADQAEDYADADDKFPYPSVAWLSTFKEKFAELIVQECANMLDEDSYLMPELGGYAHDMRQRFGVKDV